MREDRGAGVDPLFGLGLMMVLAFAVCVGLYKLGEPQMVWLVRLFQ